MSIDNQAAVSNLRMLFNTAHYYLEGTLAGLTGEQLARFPEGKPASIIAQYAHIATSEDWLVNIKAKRGAPVMATTHAGRTGFMVPPPAVGWDRWARETDIDLPALRDYAQAVYRATDDYLSSITDDDLSSPVDMSEVGQGEQTAAYVIGLALLNVALHCGEISTLKGLQGLIGYPEVKVEVAETPA